MNTLIVYTKPGCPNCELVKSYLLNRGVDHEVRDITVKDAWRHNVADMGYATVPVIVREYPADLPHGRVRDSTVGFNVPAIDKMIEGML